MALADQLAGLRATEALRPGDECEFRFPARNEWRRGMVAKNGGPGYWRVIDVVDDRQVDGLYIEHVRAPGTDPWFS
jgi:hypothetical protein